MKLADKLLGGVLYVGLIGAASLGLLLYSAIIFGVGTPLWVRISLGAVVIGLFAVGYAEGGGKSGGKDDEDTAVKRES